MARRSSILDRFDGVPLTTADLQAFTTLEERRGYRLIAFVGAVLVLGGIVLAIIDVPASGMTFNLWWVVGLIGAGLILAYGPLGWGTAARRARPEYDVVAALNEQRTDTFWYERGVADVTSESKYRGHEERP